jgi:hypothetical protein
MILRVSGWRLWLKDKKGRSGKSEWRTYLDRGLLLDILLECLGQALVKLTISSRLQVLEELAYLLENPHSQLRGDITISDQLVQRVGQGRSDPACQLGPVVERMTAGASR